MTVMDGKGFLGALCHRLYEMMKRENGYRLAAVLPMVIALAMVLGFLAGKTSKIGSAIVLGIFCLAFLIWQGPFFSFCIWLFVVVTKTRRALLTFV